MSHQSISNGYRYTMAHKENGKTVAASMTPCHWGCLSVLAGAVQRQGPWYWWYSFTHILSVLSGAPRYATLSCSDSSGNQQDINN